MKYILEGIEPQKYFQYFEEISRSAGRKVEAMNMGVRSDGAHTTSEKMSITGVTEAYEWLKKILTGLD